MTKKQSLKPLALCIGAALAASASASDADRNPFGATALPSGYALHAYGDGKAKGGARSEAKDDDKCGEGKCGEGMCGEGQCGEGKCGQGRCKTKAPDDKGEKSKTKEDGAKK